MSYELLTDLINSKTVCNSTNLIIKSNPEHQHFTSEITVIINSSDNWTNAADLTNKAGGVNMVSYEIHSWILQQNIPQKQRTQVSLYPPLITHN